MSDMSAGAQKEVDMVAPAKVDWEASNGGEVFFRVNTWEASAGRAFVQGVRKLDLIHGYVDSRVNEHPPVQRVVMSRSLDWVVGVESVGYDRYGYDERECIVVFSWGPGQPSHIRSIVSMLVGVLAQKFGGEPLTEVQAIRWCVDADARKASREAERLRRMEQYRQRQQQVAQ